MKNFKRKLGLAALSGVMMLSIVKPAYAVWYDDAINFIKGEKIELSDEITKVEAVEKLYKVLNLDVKDELKDKANDAISREELAGYIVKALVEKNIILNDDDEIIKNISDYSTIADSYKKDFAKLYNLNILVGDGVKLAPKENLTKNQFAQVLKNISELKYLEGKVTEIAKYGNLTISVKQDDVKNAKIEAGDILTIVAGDKQITAPFGDTYSNVDNKKEIVIPEKNGNIIVAINMGNFAKTYGIKIDDTVKLMLQGKKLYLEEYKIRSIDKNRTNNRDDYASDEVFANFREVKTGLIAPGVLYRTSSPINPGLKRASFADTLIKKANVKTVLNFADSEDEIKKYIADKEFNSPYYKGLFESGKVIALNMGVDFMADEFGTKLKDGLEFFAKGEAPYAIHCTEGKDRAGFVSILLEMLGGATVEEIKEDYMISYMNFFHVEKGSDQYKKIAESNVLKTLMTITKTTNMEELNKADLKSCAENYLREKIKLEDVTIKAIEGILTTGKEVKKAA
ncbi:tyrosine-protein phosphatase [Peptoniphilus mikwangii]|uniref:tyrosine-protein phosphatase n=1 Tax=Peptoniphilus mikwangii TaxID=1354300 RepID=UPI00041FFDDD|nr:tyrosine-protein phosphatase [Peptoniphilus mikwangii]